MKYIPLRKTIEQGHRVGSTYKYHIYIIDLKEYIELHVWDKENINDQTIFMPVFKSFFDPDVENLISNYISNDYTMITELEYPAKLLIQEFFEKYVLEQIRMKKIKKILAR